MRNFIENTTNDSPSNFLNFFFLNFEVIVKSNLDQDDKFKRYLNGSRMLLENVSKIYKNFMSCIQINISRSNLFPLLEIFRKIVRQLSVVFHISGLTLINNDMEFFLTFSLLY